MAPATRQAVALVVGNGLTLDLCQQLGNTLAHWDTRYPLTWSVLSPGEMTPLREVLPRFDEAVKSIQPSTSRDLSDFEIVDEVARPYRSVDGTGAEFELDCELRHYLALAYSTFQVEIDRLDMSGWRWVEYLRQIRNRYVGAFSFNYDLVYESALHTAGIAYSRIVQGETGGTPLIKPHGSIDFEYANLISGVTPRYPLSMFCGYNNTPALRVPRDALLAPRFGPELVAPLQSSLIRGFQWVDPGFRWFTDNAALLERCILVGLSYWQPDRPEIDELLSALSKRTRVVIANPLPPADLLAAIERRGLTYDVWVDGPAV